MDRPVDDIDESGEELHALLRMTTALPAPNASGVIGSPASNTPEDSRWTRMESQTLIEKVHSYSSAELNWSQIALEMRKPPLVCRAWFEALHRLKNLIPEEDKEQYRLPKKRKRRRAADVERAYPCQGDGCRKSYASEGALKTHMKTKHPDVPYVPTFLKPYVTKDPAELQNLTEPLPVPKPVAATSTQLNSEPPPPPPPSQPRPLPQAQPQIVSSSAPRMDGLFPQPAPLQPVFGTHATILSTPTLRMAPLAPPQPIFSSRDALTVLSNASLSTNESTPLVSNVPRAVLPPPSALLGTEADPTTVDIQALLQPMSVPTLPLTPTTPASPALAPPLPPPLAPPKASPAAIASSSSTQNLLDLLTQSSSSQPLDILPVDLRGSTTFSVDLGASSGSLGSSANILPPQPPIVFAPPRILSSAELMPGSPSIADLGTVSSPRSWSAGATAVASPGVVVHSSTTLPPTSTTFGSSPNLVSSPTARLNSPQKKT